MGVLETVLPYSCSIAEFNKWADIVFGEGVFFIILTIIASENLHITASCSQNRKYYKGIVLIQKIPVHKDFEVGLDGLLSQELDGDLWWTCTSQMAQSPLDFFFFFNYLQKCFVEIKYFQQNLLVLMALLAEGFLGHVGNYCSEPRFTSRNRTWASCTPPRVPLHPSNYNSEQK